MNPLISPFRPKPPLFGYKTFSTRQRNYGYASSRFKLIAQKVIGLDLKRDTQRIHCYGCEKAV